MGLCLFANTTRFEARHARENVQEKMSERRRNEVESYIQAQTRIWRERYREEGRQEGRKEAIRDALRLTAETRFGATTAAHLSDLAKRVDSKARLTEMLRWIIVCETGEELLERASGSGNGRR